LSRSWPPRVLASTRCPGQVRDSRSYTVYPKVHQPRSIVLHRLIVNQLACRQSYTAGAYISLLQSWCPTNATQVHCQHRSVRVASPTSDSRGLMVVWLGSRASTPAPLSHLLVCPPQVNFPLVVAVHQGVANRRRDETSKHLEMSASRSSPPLPDLVSIVFLFGPHAPIGSPWPCAIGSRGILCWPWCESRLRLTLNRGICALPYCIASSGAQYPSHITSDDKPAVATDRYARDRRIDALPIFFFPFPPAVTLSHSCDECARRSCQDFLPSDDKCLMSVYVCALLDVFQTTWDRPWRGRLIDVDGRTLCPFSCLCASPTVPLNSEQHDPDEVGIPRFAGSGDCRVRVLWVNSYPASPSVLRGP
jgi:hypothetical protein